ncbi:MAG: NAD(P)H-hydrate dehydratase [Gammaproteobacteria bacterium]|nr:NAD(P)H-hydrate dehydratase [Gammaproteobacteria bacterium]
MRSADELTIKSGMSGFQLLSAAGARVFEFVKAQFDLDSRILVACGTGNNGGDGMIAAQLLLDEGFDVNVALLGESKDIVGDTRLALDQLTVPLLNVIETDLSNYTLVIDALLGTGLNRPITGELARWITSVNSRALDVVSVDLPTGINGDSGEIMNVALEAEHTVTFFKPKLGHLLYPGRFHCGNLHTTDIGIVDRVLDSVQPDVYVNSQELWSDSLPALDWRSNKYTRGHTVVVAGDADGAARLAARAALRTGSGLVTLACSSRKADVVGGQVTAEMIEIVDSTDQLMNLLADSRITAIVIGPGMAVGSQTREMVSVVLKGSAPVVLDAGALTSFSAHRDALFEMVSRSLQAVVLTPHAGEFHRLFSSVTENPLTSKVTLAVKAAHQSGATVVSKGPDTVVAEPGGLSCINTNAPPWLATAGSGDVLAGTIAGWLAQGVDTFLSASMGVWLQGRAAAEFGPGLIATDIAEQYPQVLQKLRSHPEKSSL